jgi:hypothetical protein
MGVGTTMLTELEDGTRLRARAQRILTASAAISAAALSPVVCEMIFAQLAFSTRIQPSYLLLGGVWSAALGALLASGVMTRAFHGRAVPSAGSVIAWAMLGGLAYPVLLLAPSGLRGLMSSSASETLRLVVLGPIILTLVGAIISLPAGAAFGGVFWSGVSRMQSHLEKPAHDTVAHAWTSGAVGLAIAAAVLLGPVGLLEGSYCQVLFFVLFPALGVTPPEGTDLAWTRLVVMPAPLLASAAFFAWRGARHARTVARTVEALRAGTHPRWALEARGDATETTTLPLVGAHHPAVDRMLVVARDDGSPYRDGTGALAWIARTEPAPGVQPPDAPPSDTTTGPT